MTTTKSTLNLEFITQSTQGRNIIITVNNGSTDIPLELTAVSQRVASKQFESNSPEIIEQNTFNFVFAWNIDHKNVGGFSNLSATTTTINGNPGVKITLKNGSWQFGSVTGTLITSDEIQYEVINENVFVLAAFSFSIDSANCDTAIYDLDIVGGQAPFTITGSNNSPITTRDRNQQIILNRGQAKTISIVDNNNVQVGSKQIVPPKKLDPSHFDISLTQQSGAKATISSNVVLDSSIFPIEYSLDATNYQGSGEFTGLSFETLYTLSIRDVFGCVVKKKFVTPIEVDGGEETEFELSRYFFKSDAGSLSGSILNGKVLNFTNSISCEELVKLPCQTTIYQDEDEFVVEQFKSGYNYHKITLLENGQASFLQPVLQAQNLYLQEKVDCVLFRDENNLLGLYFRNGNKYIPNTLSVESGSDYNEEDLPSWAKSGNKIDIDGLGIIEIKRVTSDNDRGLYLQLDSKYTGNQDVNSIVQANFNTQPYNTYEYSMDVSLISSCAKVIIEMGFVINDEIKIEKTWASYPIQKVKFSRNYLKLQWNDPENKSGIVHQTGIVHKMLIPYVKWVHNSESSSELYQSDDQSVSLDQNVQDIATLITVATGYKMQRKLHLAAGMENFTINDINYKKRSMESPQLGGSNLYKVQAVFELGGNQLNTEAGELVLNPPETPIDTSILPPSATVPRILATANGGLVLNKDGGFILVGG